MGGVWERQIRSVCNVLSSLLQTNGFQFNHEALTTFMCVAEAIVNSRPLTTDSLNNPTSLNPLTPNHLLTMKTKVLLPPPFVFQAPDKYRRKHWRRVQHLANEFWIRWKKEYLLNLQQGQKWNKPRQKITRLGKFNERIVIQCYGLDLEKITEWTKAFASPCFQLFLFSEPWIPTWKHFVQTMCTHSSIKSITTLVTRLSVWLPRDSGMLYQRV